MSSGSGSWCFVVGIVNGPAGASDLLDMKMTFVTEQQGRAMSDAFNGRFRNAFSVLAGPGGEGYEGDYSNVDPVPDPAGG